MIVRSESAVCVPKLFVLELSHKGHAEQTQCELFISRAACDCDETLRFEALEHVDRFFLLTARHVAGKIVDSHPMSSQCPQLPQGQEGQGFPIGEAWAHGGDVQGQPAGGSYGFHAGLSCTIVRTLIYLPWGVSQQVPADGLRRRHRSLPRRANAFTTTESAKRSC